MKVSDWKYNVILIYMCTFIFLPSCKKDNLRLNTVLPEKMSDLEIGVDTRIIFSDSASVKAIISTGELIRYLGSGKNVEDFNKGVQVDFYDKDGNVFSKLESLNGQRFPIRNEVVVRDSVVFTNLKNGNRLETEELYWTQNTREIYTNRFVRITTLKDTILSYGFRADENFTWYELRSVEGIRRIEEDGSVHEVTEQDSIWIEQ